MTEFDWFDQDQTLWPFVSSYLFMAERGCTCKSLNLKAVISEVQTVCIHQVVVGCHSYKVMICITQRRDSPVSQTRRWASFEIY